MRKLLLFSVLVGLTVMAGCQHNQSDLRGIRGSAGILLRISPSEDGVIENTTDQPMRIRRVWRFNGETTKSIFLLKSHDKMSLGYIGHQTGFYIYTTDGNLVGFISSYND